MRALLPALALGLGLMLVSPRSPRAEGAPRRFALLVAHPEGGPDTERLAHAEQDARKLGEVLDELGGFPTADTRLLLSPDAATLGAALSAMEAEVGRVVASGQEALLLVYYSGHAAAGELRLGAERFELGRLRAWLEGSRATVRLAFLDACQSGAITRLKGGKRTAGFVVDVDQGPTSRGHVIITSSASDEASQESDELRGSFFTHYLVSGLRGAADQSGDGQVTLAEAYEHAYHRTVAHTAATRGGVQHPTYTYDLQGNGAVVLTRLTGLGALLFPAGASGTYLVYDRGRDLVVGEVEKRAGEPRRLSVPAGRYVVKRRATDHLLLQDLQLGAREERVVDDAAFTAVAFEDDVTKGPTFLADRRTRARALWLDARFGGQAFFDAPTRDSLFHPTALVGLRLEGANLVAPGVSAHVDGAFGQVDQVITPGPYGELVPVELQVASGGAALTFDGWFAGGDLLLQTGPRLAAIYLRRRFPQGELPFQDLFTFSPGALVAARWWLGDLSLGVSAQVHYLRYVTEVEDRSLGFGEAFLSLGYAP